MKSTISYTLLCLFTFARLSIAAVQFCHVDQEVELCLALETRENSTTNMMDFYITMGANGDLGRGWVAAGLGTGMAGSLVFLMFSDEQKGM